MDASGSGIWPCPKEARREGEKSLLETDRSTE